MRGSELGRITAFSDGVVAVAITLLVLDVKVDQASGVDSHELWELIGDQVPNLAAYVFSFALIGRYWILHHRLFERLERIDGRMMVLNLLFLALVALMPFATSLIGEYGDLAPACAVFGTVLTLNSWVHRTMVRHAERAGLEHTPLPDPSDRLTGVVLPLIYAVSVPLAFLSTVVAQVLWVGAIFVRFPLRGFQRNS